MEDQSYLDEFIAECAAEASATGKEKSIPIDWENLISILVGSGLTLLLPELKAWLKLGATAITVKRLEIRKRLLDYAKEKELDYQKAEKAAGVIADKINNKLVSALEEGNTAD